MHGRRRPYLSEGFQARTGKPVFGVLPRYEEIRIEPEDSVVIESPSRDRPGSRPAVAVLRLPHISNFNDVDPLLSMEGIDVRFVEKPRCLDGFSALILPGSKNTRWDLDWVKRTGRDRDGSRTEDGRVMGTYIHGLFDNPPILAKWPAKIGLGALEAPETGGLQARSRQYDRLADHVQRHVDLAAIEALLAPS